MTPCSTKGLGLALKQQQYPCPGSKKSAAMFGRQCLYLIELDSQLLQPKFLSRLHENHSPFKLREDAWAISSVKAKGVGRRQTNVVSLAELFCRCCLLFHLLSLISASFLLTHFLRRRSRTAAFLTYDIVISSSFSPRAYLGVITQTLKKEEHRFGRGAWCLTTSYIIFPR
jgi:hypothetical protein